MFRGLEFFGSVLFHLRSTSIFRFSIVFFINLWSTCLLYADDSLDRLQKIKLILQYYSFFLCHCASTNCLSLYNYFLISISSPLINIYFRKKTFSSCYDASCNNQILINCWFQLHRVDTIKYIDIFALDTFHFYENLLTVRHFIQGLKCYILICDTIFLGYF